MTRELRLGKIAGLELWAMPSAWIGLAGLWVVLAGIGVFLLELTPGEAILGGLAAALLHWVSELGHQLGHAWAARRTGHPMVGVRFWGVLGTSIYPQNEPEMPAKVHIRRALGGPEGSFFMTGLAALVFLVLMAQGSVWMWVGAFFFLDNLLVFTLGAFIPTGFSDGSTLLAWRGKP